MEHANKIYIALAAALLASTSAQAQQGESSWGLLGGYQRGATSSAGDSATVDLGGTPANVTIAGETDAPNGYFLGIVWDRQVSDHWTMGGELSYRNSSMDLSGRMSATAGGTTDAIPASGDASLHTVALMANLWRYSAPMDSVCALLCRRRYRCSAQSRRRNDLCDRHPAGHTGREHHWPGREQNQSCLATRRWLGIPARRDNPRQPLLPLFQWR